MKQFDSALIGCGRIGYLLHKDPLRKKPCTHFHGALSAGIKFNYAVDINPQRLSEISKNEKIDKNCCYTNYNDLFKDITPKIVSITTWTNSHDSIAVKAAEAGVKTIVLEKPIASSIKKAQKILDACSLNGSSLFINHERRYDSRYDKVKEIINNNKIGEVKTVYASVYTGPYKGKSLINEGGGPLLHDGTHLIDIIRFFFGEVNSAQCKLSRIDRTNGYEDTAHGWLTTDSGINIFLEAGGGRKYFGFELIISGTEGKVVIGNGYEKLYFSGKSKFYRGFNDLVSIQFPKIKSNNYFTSLYKEVLKTITNPDHSISSSGQDGLKALEIIHGLYYSSYKDGKPIDFPLNKTINLKKIFEI